MVNEGAMTASAEAIGALTSAIGATLEQTQEEEVEE